MINLHKSVEKLKFGLECTIFGQNGLRPTQFNLFIAQSIVSFYNSWEYITLVGTLVIVSYKFSACNYCLVQLFTCFCPFRNSAGFLLWSEWGRGNFKGGLISDCCIFNLVPYPPKLCEISVPQYLNFNL